MDDQHIAAPLEGMSASEIEAWLENHTDEGSLAMALASVHNQTGDLMHEVMEAPYEFAAMLLREWCTLEDTISRRVITLLEMRNRTRGTSYETQNGLPFELVRPFMEENGYAEQQGLWVK